MVEITEIVYPNLFEDEASSVKDKAIHIRLAKLIAKITANPKVGKPLRFSLKGERTAYIKPYRLIYAVDGNKLLLLRFEHRKDVYDD